MAVKLREKKLKGGGVSFYLDISHSGRRWYEFLDIHAKGAKRSAEFVDQKKLAEKARDARQYQLTVEKHHLPNEQKQDADVIAFIQQQAGKRKSGNPPSQLVKKLQGFTGEEVIPFHRINKEFLLKFQEYLQTSRRRNKKGELKGIAQSTIYMLVHLFSTFLNKAVAKGHLPANPYQKVPRSERVKQKRGVPSYLTAEEIETLAANSRKVHPQLKLAFLFSCFSGLRWSDCSRLKWSQITRQKIEGQEIYVMRIDQTKTDQGEYVPLSAQALQCVERRKAEAAAAGETPSLYVFPFLVEAKEESAKQRWAIDEMKKWGKAAKLHKRVHFHLGRHTFATLTLSEGADLYTVSKLLGHTEIKSTQIYAHVVNRLKMEAVARLPKINMDGLEGSQLRAV